MKTAKIKVSSYEEELEEIINDIVEEEVAEECGVLDIIEEDG